MFAVEGGTVFCALANSVCSTELVRATIFIHDVVMCSESFNCLFFKFMIASYFLGGAKKINKIIAARPLPQDKTAQNIRKKS